MRILVTGGAGFIGSHTVDRLLVGGHAVIAFDDFNDYYNPAFKRRNLQGALKNPKFQLIEGDISRLEAVRDLFQKTKPEMVIHLAARAGVRASVQKPFLYQRVNVEGTLNILECAKEAGVKKITFGSTSSIYGLNVKVPFNENDLVNQTASPYAATKLAGEALCRAYSHLYEMDIAVLRFFSVYGPRGRPDMAIYLFTEQIMMGKPIPMFGKGDFLRDYTYIDDIIQGIMATVDRKFGFEIFNLGEAKNISVRDLVGLIEKATGKKAKIEKHPEQPGDVPKTFADISKAGKVLGYNPRTGIEEGIPKFVEWFKKQALADSMQKETS